MKSLRTNFSRPDDLAPGTWYLCIPEKTNKITYRTAVKVFSVEAPYHDDSGEGLDVWLHMFLPSTLVG